MSEEFVLDARLAADSVLVADLCLSTVRLMNDANFPWLLMIPRRPGLGEIIDLDATDRQSLMDEIATVSTALRAVTRCRKLNVAALGNQVAQLHVHVIARFAEDPAWPGPVWGAAAARAYDETAKDRLIADLRDALDAS
ncbi:MAG: HIT family protein [Hyphomicrobiales bacterium]|nr:HIT family protein [Hyphomicrobiales bacterium]